MTFRTRMFRGHRTIALCLAGLLSVGCSRSAPTGPSYADALVIYNQQLQILDRLKAQRDQRVASLETPDASALGDVASQLLGNSVEMQKELGSVLADLEGPGGPSDSPQVRDAREKQDELMGTLGRQLETAREGQEKRGAEREAKKKEVKAEIARLDKEIEVQQAKVDHAKADLDRAEAARN